MSWQYPFQIKNLRNSSQSVSCIISAMTSQVPWCNQLFPIPFSEPDVSTRVVEFNFPFHSSWFARWKWRTWSSRTVLSLLSGGVKFSKSHFPEISMGAAKVDLLQRLQRAATDNACTSTRIFFPCKLILISEDYLDFCLRNCNVRDFSLFWAQSWMFGRRKIEATLLAG